MGTARYGIWILGDGVDDGVEDRIYDAVGQGFRVVLAVEEAAVCLCGWYCGRVAHVELEGLIDVEVDVVHVCRGEAEGYRRRQQRKQQEKETVDTGNQSTAGAV